MRGDFYFRRHPIFANILIIITIAILGVIIVFLSLNLFTKHGQTATVPGVENMTYTEAIKTLRKHGFRTDIRDSIFNEEIPPGYVVEQFPKSGSTVKPGRKIFLYINAVHPKEVLIDGENNVAEAALKGYSKRQALAKLEELGFKNVNVVTVPGDDDRVVRLVANGKTVMKMQKVPINAVIKVEVRDGALRAITDSILEKEYLEYVVEEEDYYEEGKEDEEVEDIYQAPAEPEVVTPEESE